jgi:acyl-CoA synthetase (AMP-forming)/AMP-acid ligase II
MKMPITEILKHNAELFGDETSLVEISPEKNEGRREITWRGFDENANRFANLLLERGLKEGSKVAILLMNCLEWLPAYFGILKAGALAVPLNFRNTAEEIRYCLDLAECDALVFGPEFKERVEGILGQLPKLKTCLFLGDGCPGFAESFPELTGKCSGDDPGTKLSDDMDAVIYFSSGTTGFPKAILHTHRSLMTACEVELNHHRQTREDNFLCIPPLYHTGAKMHWFGSLLSGSKAVLLRGVKPEWIMETISSERITIAWLLVPWAQDILDAMDRGDIKPEGLNLSQWRLMHMGAQPIPPSLIRRWNGYFPGQEYDTNYGLSEAIGPGCVNLGLENSHKVGAIGTAGHSWQVRIVGEDEKPVEPGKVGELCVKGSGVMKCYFRNPEATAEVLKDGWLFTGDMARMDEDGFIHLVDRKKDVIISGGENIYPVQIEDFLRSHKAIKDVAGIGMPDKRLGEVTAVVIELKPGFNCTREEIEEFCRELPRYKRPRHIIFEDIPRNPTGKIEKPKLRQKHCGNGFM